MTQPHLCVIHEAIGKQSAIARVAASGVRQALAAGWKVSVVAQLLDPELRDQVDWLPLFVPRRLFLLKWLTARRYIRKALGGRTFDVVHSHQPQVADLSDVFQCHYLTRVAFERRSFESRPGLRYAIVRAQQRAVLYAEDHCFHRWNPQTWMLFTSEMMRQEFHRLYGTPSREDILVSPPPPLNFPTDEERRRARASYVGDYPGIVVGYLGGLH